MFTFHIYFLNIDISLNTTLMFLKMSLHSAETRLEGSVSQNFNIDLSFNFMVHRKRDFEKKKSQKVTKVTRFLLQNENQGINKKSETCFPRLECF